MTKEQASYLLNHLRDYKKTIKIAMEYYGYPGLQVVIKSIDKCIKDLERE